MKKRYSLLVLAALMALCLCACQNAPESPAASAPDASASASSEAEGSASADVSAEVEGEEAASSSAPAEEITADVVEQLIADADYTAAGYDYDGAIELLKSVEGWESSEAITAKIASYEEQKAACVPIDHSKVTHIFYHTLLRDAQKCFDQPDGGNFKQWMCTIDEFNKITQKLYENDFVIVGIHDLVEETVDEKGITHYSEKPLYLPKGKKPMVFSIDDLSYYYTYMDHGMATKLVLDDEGKVTCEYIEDDGTTTVGAYDVLPLLNKFLEEHPDGAYHNARGIIALTGYNGVFGYRTDIYYKDQINEELNKDQIKWLEDHPDFDGAKEVEQATAVADAIKESGWLFASHTWGHLRVSNIEMERLKTDTEKWETRVKPVVGDTDILIFAHGADLVPWYEKYDGNANYEYLNKHGFHYYMNVDSNKYTFQINDNYVHMGRRNIDGYRLWKDAYENGGDTDDFFDAKEMIDPIRTDMPPLS